MTAPQSRHALLEQPTHEFLIAAYRAGWFPMADSESGTLEWFSPDPRGILPLNQFRVPASLARVVRSGRLQIRGDTAFDQVVRACAAPRADAHSGWIDQRLLELYLQLHRLGYAHSIEAWRDGQLVGGLYGIHIGGAFFGESMFCRPDQGGTDASKVCLVHLVDHMRAAGLSLLDTQFWTEHLAQFGCIQIERAQYLALLAEVVDRPLMWDAGGQDKK
jgi:leucyl/phenylalanyl-tRNA--protein transferase